ncbi:MAG: fumarylacetoacetate hydrolase family protein [Planctomycetota bacterium]
MTTYPLLHHDHGVAVDLGSTLLPLRQILGVGLNYAQHAHEQGLTPPERPLIFTKNPAAAALHGDPIVVPKICQDREQVDFEGELAVIIGHPTLNATPEDAHEAILGYCCANDVSARWWQKKGSGKQFFRGKSFDTFCPLGPLVVSRSEIAEPQALTLYSRVNGVEKQRSTTGDMVFPILELIVELSRGMTLLPGTVILTGTPSGVGFARTPPEFAQHGDVVEVEIDGLGVLRNTVAFE